MLQTLRSKDWFHKDGFPLAVERRDPQGAFGLHDHDFSEIVIVTGGTGTHVSGKISWPLSAGDAFVIGGKRAHAYRDVRKLGLINILFQPGKLRMELQDLSTLPGYHALFSLEPLWKQHFKSRLHLPPKKLALVAGLVDQLDEELQARKGGFGFLATALFMQIVVFLARSYTQEKNPDSQALLRIAEAISHLETHYNEEVEAADLARIAHMSQRSFFRVFQAAMGMPPMAYLLQLRIQRAAALLRDSALTITEIAYEVGFNDSNYFTRQFKKHFNQTPKQYRTKAGA